MPQSQQQQHVSTHASLTQRPIPGMPLPNQQFMMQPPPQQHSMQQSQTGINHTGQMMNNLQMQNQTQQQQNFPQHAINQDVTQKSMYTILNQQQIKQQQQMVNVVPTLYVRNLNDKIKTDEMKITLFHLFSQVGEVIEINMRNTNNSQKLRGQAFIVFREQDMADRGLQELKGFNLFGKSIDIQYAKQNSDVTLKNKGVFDDSIRLNRRQKRKQKDELKRKEKKEKLVIAEQQLKQQLNYKEMALKQSNAIAIDNLPGNYNQLLLQELLRNYPGVADYNLDVEKHVATVHFHTSNDAKVALAGLNQYQIDSEGTQLRVTFVTN
eukprot:403363680